MEYEVTVEIDGRDVHVGRLYCQVRRGIETSSFSYADEYLRRPDAFALAPDMPLIEGTLHSSDAPMFRAFQDCMPDRWGRTLMKRAERNAAREEHRTARTLFEGDMLAGVNDETRQGALRIWSDGTALSPNENGVPREVSLPDLLDSSDRAAADMNADVRDLLAAGSSLGGARPKASVKDEQGRLLIAKFPRTIEDEGREVCAWERTALQLASKCGIHVPRTRLLRIRGRAVLLLERFDRMSLRNRIPYLSGMTAVQGRDGEHYSYLELAEFLESEGSAPQTDIPQLWKRALFDCAIGNTDNHMRNHGFLRTRQGWALAPAFDVNPTVGDNPKALNTSIDYDDDSAEPEAAIAVSDLFRVPRDMARSTARDMAQVLSGWRRVASANGISSSSIDSMETCFQAGTDKLNAASRK